MRVYVRKCRSHKDCWYIRVTDPQGVYLAELIWPGNAARNWFGLQGAVDMALARARVNAGGYAA